MTRSTRVLAAVLGAVACTLVSTVTARRGMAQGSVYAVAQYEYGSPSNDLTIPGCGSATTTQSTASYSCGPVPVGAGLYTGSGFASAFGGQLRASTSGSAVLAGQGGAVSSAQSFWTDYASVSAVGSGPAATQLQIALHLTGTLSGMGADVSGQQGSSSMAIFRIPSGNSYLQYQFTNGPGNETSPTYATSVDQIFLMTLALSNGYTPQFRYGVTVFTGLTNTGTDLANPTLTGSAAADFSHTVDPLWYHVLDADGNDVSSAYDVTFANGMAFGPQTLTTPEPSSAALFATGLLGLVPVLRRRSH